MSRLALAKYSRSRIHGGSYGTIYGGNILSWLRKTGRRLLNRVIPHAQNALPAIVPALFSSNNQERSQAFNMLKDYGKKSVASLIDEGINIGKDGIESGINKLRNRMQNVQAKALGGRSSKVMDEDFYTMKKENGSTYQVNRIEQLSNKLNRGINQMPIGSSPLNPDKLDVHIVPDSKLKFNGYIPGNTASYFSPNHLVLESRPYGTYAHLPEGVIHDDYNAIKRMQNQKQNSYGGQSSPSYGGSIASSLAQVNKKAYAQQNPKNLGNRTVGRHKEENPKRTRNSKRSNTSKTTRSNGRVGKIDVIDSSLKPISNAQTSVVPYEAGPMGSSTNTSTVQSSAPKAKGGRKKKKNIDDFVKTARSLSFE